MGRGWKILIAGAGHSPNVEKPAETAALVLVFDKQKTPANHGKASGRVQADMQNRQAVRGRP